MTRKFLRNSPDIFEQYGLRRIVNVSGTETEKGACPVFPEILEAVEQLAGYSVEMGQLQSVASSVIADVLGVEGGYVTNCSASGIAIAVAGCMTGCDLGAVQDLPTKPGKKNEVIVQKGHNVSYGCELLQNIEVTGARVIEVGTPFNCGAYHVEKALSENTACGVFVICAQSVQAGLYDLESYCHLLHSHGIPVVVDAAAEPDPRRYFAAGADVVIFSMQKRFGSLTAGVVAGRLDLVKAAMYHQEGGLGRLMKVGKERVISTIAGMQLWARRDFRAEGDQLDARLRMVETRLGRLKGIRTAIEIDTKTPTFSQVAIYVDPTAAGLTASQLNKALLEQTPSIFLRGRMASMGKLQMDLRLVDDEMAEWICECIENVFLNDERSSFPVGAYKNRQDEFKARLDAWPDIVFEGD